MTSFPADRPTADILPLVVVNGASPLEVEPVAALGTGFLIAPNLLVTCWHCVDVSLAPGHHLAAAREHPPGHWKAHFLFDVARDTGGVDLATARVDLKPECGLQLSRDNLPSGADVWTFGYPLPTRRERSPGKYQLVLPHRFVKGYIMRDFLYEHPTFGTVPSYELDMPTPSGLSGAPIIRLGSRTIVGVVYGTHDVATIEEAASVDADSGVRSPEIHRIVSFGLALHTSALGALRTPSTENVPLSSFLQGTG